METSDDDIEVLEEQIRRVFQCRMCKAVYLSSDKYYEHYKVAHLNIPMAFTPEGNKQNGSDFSSSLVDEAERPEDVSSCGESSDMNIDSVSSSPIPPAESQEEFPKLIPSSPTSANQEDNFLQLQKTRNCWAKPLYLTPSYQNQADSVEAIASSPQLSPSLKLSFARANESSMSHSNETSPCEPVLIPEPSIGKQQEENVARSQTQNSESSFNLKISLNSEEWPTPEETPQSGISSDDHDENDVENANEPMAQVKIELDVRSPSPHKKLPYKYIKTVMLSDSEEDDDQSNCNDPTRKTKKAMKRLRIKAKSIPQTEKKKREREETATAPDRLPLTPPKSPIPSAPANSEDLREASTSPGEDLKCPFCPQPKIFSKKRTLDSHINGMHREEKEAQAMWLDLRQPGPPVSGNGDVLQNERDPKQLPALPEKKTDKKTGRKRKGKKAANQKRRKVSPIQVPAPNEEKDPLPSSGSNNPFVCIKCGDHFTSLDNLKNHAINEHYKYSSMST